MKLFPTFFKFSDFVNIKYFQLNQLIKYFHWVFSFSFTDKGNLFFPPWDQIRKVKYATFYLWSSGFYIFIIISIITQNEMTSNRQKCGNLCIYGLSRAR